MSYRNLGWLLIVSAVVVFIAGLNATAPPPDKDYQLVRSFVDVIAEVDRSYYRPLSDAERRKLVEDMISGGLTRLDRNSQYFNEKEYRKSRSDTEGFFGGIGAVLSVDPGTDQLMVEYPMIGTPAYEAGLEPGDLIVKVGDVLTKSKTVDEMRDYVMGQPGTKVVLHVIQAGSDEPKPIEITRAKIEVHPVQGFVRKPDAPTEWEFLADPAQKIAMIRISSFNESTSREVKEAVRQAEAAGAKALILDLRGNPGGLFWEAVRVSNMFLGEGKIVGTKDRNGKEEWVTAEPRQSIFGPADKKPMALLVDSGSASASEILASALQDNHRAVVIGERSYGKGSVQEIHELADKRSAVKLTTKLWLRPNGKKIHRETTDLDTNEWGVKPDQGFDVKLTTDERIQYYLHLRRLNMGGKIPKEGKANPNRPKLDPNFKDAVLEKALEHLRGKLKEIALAPAHSKPS